MTKLGDMFHIPVTDRLNKRRPCVQKTIGRSGTLFCHFLLILVRSAFLYFLYRGGGAAASIAQEPPPRTALLPPQSGEPQLGPPPPSQLCREQGGGPRPMGSCLDRAGRRRSSRLLR
jgi:hypothetical protein